MARSRDTRHPLPAERGPKRTGPIGTILPGDDVEVAREIQRLWWAIQQLRAPKPCCSDGVSAPTSSAGSLDVAVRAPGTLLARYQYAEASGDALDTAGHATGPFDATYVENQHDNTSVSPNQLWASGHSATRLTGAHPEFGPNDDGAVAFNYDQDGWITGGSYSFNDDGVFPGSYFTVPSGLAGLGGTVKSVGTFFRPRSDGAGLVGGPLIDSSHGNSSGGGRRGWTLGVDSTGVVSIAPGAYSHEGITAPSAVTLDEWHFAMVTFDDADPYLMSLYIDGELVGTSTTGGYSFGTYYYGITNDVDAVSFGRAQCGDFSFNTGLDYETFYWGDMDETLFYTAVLTADEISDIWDAGASYVAGLASRQFYRGDLSWALPNASIPIYVDEASFTASVGGTLLPGDAYFDTTDLKLRLYASDGWHEWTQD